MGSLHIWDEVPAQAAILYNYFEKELGLKKTTIRTDYRFADIEQAVDLSTFFFGDEVGAEMKQTVDPIMPEATAIWHGRIA
jgi:hypothetical protein